MLGNDAAAQQAFRPAFERAAGYLEEIQHVLKENDECHKSCHIPGACNEFPFLLQTGNSTRHRTKDSANVTASFHVSSQYRTGVNMPTWRVGILGGKQKNKRPQTAPTVPTMPTFQAQTVLTLPTVPTTTEFTGPWDTMAASDGVSGLKCALLDGFWDEGLPGHHTVQQELHGTMNRTSTLQGRNEYKLDHTQEHGELSHHRKAMQQLGGENEQLRSQLETSQAQFREMKGEMALLRQECAELRLQLRNRDAELAKVRKRRSSLRVRWDV